MEALIAQHLSLSYGHGANSALAVEDINLSIPRGRSVLWQALRGAVSLP
ncbi:hypothetical protein ACS6XI_03750 [Porphyromonas endodontalis]